MGFHRVRVMVQKRTLSVCEEFAASEHLRENCQWNMQKKEIHAKNLLLS